MERWKSRGGKSQRGEAKKWEDQRKSEKHEDAGARKGRKVTIHCVFFQWFVAPEGRKVTSLKRRVRSHLARWEMNNCTPLWREAHFQVKSVKNRRSQTTFGSWDVEKVHAVVARSTCRNQNVQRTPGPDHFCTLRCRKSARCCGAKHISKSKCWKHYMLRPLFDVQMWKMCTPLWPEAHSQVKGVKNCWVRTTFWRSDCTTIHSIALHYNYNSNYNFTTATTTTTTTLHPTTPHYTTLHYTTLRYITPRYTTPHYTTLHCSALHYITPQ